MKKYKTITILAVKIICDIEGVQKRETHFIPLNLMVSFHLPIQNHLEFKLHAILNFFCIQSKVEFVHTTDRTKHAAQSHISRLSISLSLSSLTHYRS